MSTLRALSDDEIRSYLTRLPGWQFTEGQIQKTFRFNAYKAGVTFAVAVAHMADAADHHPDLFIGYQRVEVGLNTHDVNGISEKDFALAEKIERFHGLS